MRQAMSQLWEVRKFLRNAERNPAVAAWLDQLDNELDEYLGELRALGADPVDHDQRPVGGFGGVVRWQGDVVGAGRAGVLEGSRLGTGCIRVRFCRRRKTDPDEQQTNEPGTSLLTTHGALLG